MSTWKKLARVLGMLLLVAVASLVLAIAVNLALFKFGPWADVWVEQTWAGLGLAGVVLACATRRRWLDGHVSTSS